MRTIASSIRLVVLSCCWLAAISSIKGQEPTSLADLIATIEPSVVRIETPDGIGSGFVATNDGVVVTNLHVLSGSSEAKIRFIDGKTFDVLGVLASDEERDIAIISTSCSGVNPLKVASALPRKGTSVVTFGAPAGLSFSASEGIVSAIRSGSEAKTQINRDSGTWLQTTAPISPGNSGGPLVDRKGQVVGVNTFYVTRGQNLNFAISSIDIAELLKKSKGNSPTPLSEKVAKMSPRQDAGLDKTALQSIVRDYLKKSQPTAKELIDTVNGQVVKLDIQLRLMKAGRVNKKLRYSSSGYRKEVIRNREKYFFFSDEIKDKVLDQQTKKLDELRQTRSKMAEHGEGLVLVAMVGGPKLSLSEPGSLGRVDGIEVSQVTGADEFHGYIGRTRVAVKGVPTATLLTDQVLTDGLFVFSGVEAYETRLGTENRIARLTYIPKDSFVAIGRELASEFAPAMPASNVVAHAPEVSSELAKREWTDLTGNFKVTAEFVKVDDSMVSLRRQSGEVIRVPIQKLSLKDQEWLKAKSSR